MTKTLMTLDAMHRHPEVEWLFFLDADAWINAEWLDMPLDVFLEEVEEDKLWIHTNYRSMLTGVFFVRNNAAGRNLVRDWVAVGMSGQISCHGFDQAAIMIVFMMRQAGVVSERPYNLSCLSSEHRSTETGLLGTGCSGGADYSCDYRFEQVMVALGFRTPQNNSYLGDWFSSYSRGCANKYIRQFHVSYETEFRPRLQCFHCGKTYEIESGHWEGPLGGSNDKVRKGAVNSYFSNHKALWLFYEQYLEPGACLKIDFLNVCDFDFTNANDVGDLIWNERERELFYANVKYGRRLFSIVDGIAIDLETGIFCKLDPNSATVALQRSVTYMRDYSKVIDVALNYSESFWAQQYRTQGSSPSRVLCSPHTKVQDCPDGLNWRPKESNWFLLAVESPNECSACRTLNNNAFDSSGERKVLDCSNGAGNAAVFQPPSRN